MKRALVIGLSQVVTQAEAESFRAYVERRLPGVEVVVISGCSSLATIPLDEETDP
jgi:hypothetical protein